MIIGLVSKSSTAESLLNNFSEAGFEPNQISIILRDSKLRDALADDVGPFKGASISEVPKRLAELGLSEAEVKTCVDAVTRDKVLVVIACSLEGEPIVTEMLKDASAEFIKVVRK